MRITRVYLWTLVYYTLVMLGLAALSFLMVDRSEAKIPCEDHRMISPPTVVNDPSLHASEVSLATLQSSSVLQTIVPGAEVTVIGPINVTVPIGQTWNIVVDGNVRVLVFDNTNLSPLYGGFLKLYRGSTVLTSPSWGKGWTKVAALDTWNDIMSLSTGYQENLTAGTYSYFLAVLNLFGSSGSVQKNTSYLRVLALKS